MENKNKKVSDLEKERLLDPEEIIEFNYYDRINKKNIVIRDKRRVKIALDEMDEYEKKQKDSILKNECSFNENTDEVYLSVEMQKFEHDLESSFQEVVDKINKQQQISEKIKKFLKNNITSLSEKQTYVLFLHYFLDFTNSEIAEISNTSKQRISQIIKKVNQKLKEKSVLGVD